VIAFIVGFGIARVGRAAAVRRRVDPLEVKIAQLENSLATTRQAAPVTSAPAKRWTATEIAAILGAIGTLVGAIAAFATNYQGRSLKEYQDKFKVADERVKTLEQSAAELETKTRAVVAIPIAKWSALDRVNGEIPKKKNQVDVIQVADRDVTAPCADRRLRLTYNGTVPGMIRCAGNLSLELRKPTRVLLVPDR
jgi:hypothetical protein